MNNSPQLTRRRVTRSWSLQQSPQAEFCLDNSAERLPVIRHRVVDIAELGAKVSDADSFLRLPMRVPHPGILILGGVILVRLQFQVVYWDEETVGLEFLDPTPQLRIAISRFFAPELAASTMRTATGGSMDPLGISHHVTYEDPSVEQWMEISRSDTGVQAVRGHALGLRGEGVDFDTDREALPASTTPEGKGLLRWLHNVPELEQTLLQAIEGRMSSARL